MTQRYDAAKKLDTGRHPGSVAGHFDVASGDRPHSRGSFGDVQGASVVEEE